MESLVKELFSRFLEKEAGSPTKHHSRISNVGQMVTIDQRIVVKYSDVVEGTAFDDFWDSVEDLSQTVEKIGSNDVLGSQSSCSSSRKELKVEEDNPIKRRRFEENSNDKKEKRL
ncbi:unnamed protein product [Cuscuta campestris]|uniref:Uncharacterized protein n=1 Tax=Cuscuta campestris TaxID=132261 RepID=A0A484M4R7_9ASTE|nr:unnamed protein product [Cuscuta campestris]